jgi:hypothetical protein
MKKLGNVLRGIIALLLFAGLAVALTACKPKVIELPFETIERLDQSGTGEMWKPIEPGLMVIATAEDLAEIDGLFTKDAQAQLREMDYETYFAVAAFLGHRGSVSAGIWIEQVVRRGDEIAIYVGQQTKSFTQSIETSPYHLVKVRKEGRWGRTIRFTLCFEGPTHFVP